MRCSLSIWRVSSSICTLASSSMTLALRALLVAAAGFAANCCQRRDPTRRAEPARTNWACFVIMLLLPSDRILIVERRDHVQVGKHASIVGWRLIGRVVFAGSVVGQILFRPAFV